MKKVTEKLLWVDDPNYQSNSKYIELSDTDKKRVDFFVENGYVIIKNDVKKELVDSFRDKFSQFKIVNQEYLEKYRDVTGYISRMINFHQKFDVLKSMFTNSSALAFQDLLLSSETVVYTSLLFERGTSQPIHRDIPYFWTDPSNHYLGMWVALEDTNIDNGALIGVPKGHKLLDRDRSKYAKLMGTAPEDIKSIDIPLWNAYQDELMNRIKKENLEVTALPLEKGDVIIWHPLFPHGGGALEQPIKSRLSVVFHTIPKDTAVYQADTFFNPDKQVPLQPQWMYNEFEGRLFINHRIDIGHRDDFSATELNW